MMMDLKRKMMNKKENESVKEKKTPQKERGNEL